MAEVLLLLTVLGEKLREQWTPVAGVRAILFVLGFWLASWANPPEPWTVLDILALCLTLGR